METTVSKKGVKKKLIGKAETLTREAYEKLARQERIALIRRLIPLGLMAVAEELQKEVDELVTQAQEPGSGKSKIVRYGSNEGSVVLGNQRVPVKVPRVRNEQGEVPLESYALLHGDNDSQTLFQSVLGGISCKGYSATIGEHSGSIAKSKSTVSRKFVEMSEKELKAFQNRSLSDHDFIAIFIDGTPLSRDQMIIVLGITIEGKKIILGFVQSATENALAISQFIQSLFDRGLKVDQGLLAIVDGSKGITSALKKSFLNRIIIQRCQWHKRENVVSYLSKTEQGFMKKRLQNAYERPILSEAHALLSEIQKELNETNQSAAASLQEGFNETLTLHRLGMFAKIGLSLKTTNCLESINSQAENYCGKVRRWKNSSQKQRWMASALLQIAPNLRTIKGYQHLPSLREAIKKELGL